MTLCTTWCFQLRVPVTGDLIAASARADWVTTITDRLGFTGHRRPLMFYTKGGGWVQKQSSIADSTVPAVGITETTGGWIWGAGAEWAFAQNWTM